MCEYCVDDLKMAEQWTLVAEIERHVILAEAGVGLSFPGAIRPLTDHEILARVNFGDIAALQNMAGDLNETFLLALRHVFTTSIVNQLGADTGDAQAAARRIMDILRQPPSEVAAAVTKAAGQLHTAFKDVYHGAVGIVGEEVVRQGIRPANFDSLVAPDILETQANAVAMQHWTALTDKVAKNHLSPSAIVNGKLSKADVQATLDAVPLAGALDAARQAVHTAHGAGRFDAGDMQGASDIWASELLDGKTCEPCAKIDLTHYKSMAAAKEDYPMGGYRACLGEARCRGTLVFLYLEPGNTGVDPDGNVTGQISIGPNPPKDGLGLPPAVDTPPPAPKGDLQQRIRESIDALNVDAHLGGKSFRDTVTGMSNSTVENMAAQKGLQKLHQDFAQLVPMPDGYRIEADSVFGLAGEMQVDYNFITSAGTHVGHANRVYSVVDGMFKVEHHIFKLDETAQGHGISSRFLAASEQFYAKLGVQEITVHANIDVGGYAWAKSGFDWADKYQAGNFADYTLTDHKMNKYVDIYPDDFSAMKKLRRKLTRENYEAGTAPTPYDIAMVGYTPGATSWLGKELMLGSSWLGKKAVLQPAAKVLTLKEQIKLAVDKIDIHAHLDGRSFTEMVDGLDFGNDDNTANALVLEKLHDKFAAAIPLPDGYTMAVINMRPGYGNMYIDYEFKGPDGTRVGTATRQYYQQDGKWKVDHKLFALDQIAQGHGISSRFLAASEAFYRRLGIKEISIHANLDVGGYAWAKAGFDWKDSGYMKAFASDIKYTLDDYNRQPRREIQALLDRMTVDNWNNGTAPVPYDFAMLGHTEGATNWYGKTLMLAANWYGKKTLT